MFQFESVSLDNFLKGIKNLSAKNGNFKNIPTHCLKKFVDICSPILTQIWISDTINRNFFLQTWNWQIWLLFLKKIQYQRCLRNSCGNSLTFISTNSYRHFYVATEKDTTLNLNWWISSKNGKIVLIRKDVQV